MAPETFTPVAGRRAFEEAVDQIAEAIRVGDLRVGDRLPPERELSAQMGISRPTLRAAIKVLADAGVIVVMRGAAGGSFVSTEVVPSELLRDRADLHVGEVFGILEARRALEPRVAQLAGLHAVDEDFEAMERSIELQRECEDRDRFVQLDTQFHMAIARSTRNSTLVSLMRVLMRRVEVARDSAIRVPHEPDVAIALHERTLAAIKSADPQLIEGSMDEHLRFLEKIWEEETGRARVRPIPEFLLGDGGSR